MILILYFIALIAGFVFLVKGSDFFVDGAAGIAKRFGIPEIVIGLTIVAIGTSAPEAAVSLTAAMKGSADLTIGNIIGSNIMNILVILGISAAIVPLAVQKNTARIEIPYMILISLILFLFGLDGSIRFYEGLLLCLCLVIYIVYLYVSTKKHKEDVETEEVKEERRVSMQILSLLGGLAAIMIGSKLAVYGATEIAEILGVSERFIGLTVVALGTSLPELFTSVTAARKGNADIAIGNIVGSNLLNIIFVVALTAVITPVPYASKFTIDSMVMLASAMSLFLFVIRTKKLGRAAGVIMVAGYIAYFAYLCMA